MEIRYPQLRAQLLEELAHLSDLDYQKRVWITTQFDSEDHYDSLDDSIHFLFDDTSLAEDAQSTVGVILTSKQEAIVIAALTQFLGRLVDHLGDIPATSYMDSPEWPQVIQLASTARDLLTCHSGR